MAYKDSYQFTRSNLSLFYTPVDMSGGYTFDHALTLKRIDLYYNSRFETGARDSKGFRKYFYNIVKPACDVATKFIDLDTKDIVLYSTAADQEYKVWLMERDLRQWLKNEKFGQLINELCIDYPKNGHVVVKRDKSGSWCKTNIGNLRMEPSVRCLDESSFVYEVLSMYAKDMKEMKWYSEEVEAFLIGKDETEPFIVYECYERNPIAGKKWKRSFRTDFLRVRTSQGGNSSTPESQINSNAKYYPGYTLYEDDMDDLPYREKKWEEIPGRWLGLGVVEYLYDNQIRANEVANLKAKGLIFTSKHVFQTPDENLGRNILTEFDDGDILKSSTGISPVPMEERNLGAFAQEEQRWDLNSERKTFTFDISRGGELPSGTPLGVARLSAGMVSSYFDIKRENLGFFIKDLLVDDVIPSFQKQNAKEHYLKFFSSDRDIAKLHKTLTKHTIRKAILDYIMRTATVPSALAIELERKRLELTVKKKKDIYLKIPSGFYTDAKFEVDITVTGEEIDVGSKLQTLQTAMQVMGANPGIMENPATRTVLMKMLELAGVSAVELDLMNEQADEMGAMPQMPQGRGGNLPSPPPVPVQPVSAQETVAV